MSDSVPEALWEQVLRLLQRRAHTRLELRRKLQQRGHPEPDIEAAIAKAQRLSLMGAEGERAMRHAEALARRSRSTPAWVKHKLLARGFEPSDAQAAVDDAFRSWRPTEAALPLLENEQDLDRGARRLLRRGFPAEAVWAAVRKLRRERHHEESDFDPE